MLFYTDMDVRTPIHLSKQINNTFRYELHKLTYNLSITQRKERFRSAQV
jgi:hypothetical protein